MASTFCVNQNQSFSKILLENVHVHLFIVGHFQNIGACFMTYTCIYVFFRFGVFVDSFLLHENFKKYQTHSIDEALDKFENSPKMRDMSSKCRNSGNSNQNFTEKM